MTLPLNGLLGARTTGTTDLTSGRPNRRCWPLMTAVRGLANVPGSIRARYAGRNSGPSCLTRPARKTLVLACRTTIRTGVIAVLTIPWAASRSRPGRPPAAARESLGFGATVGRSDSRLMMTGIMLPSTRPWWMRSRCATRAPLSPVSTTYSHNGRPWASGTCMSRATVSASSPSVPGAGTCTCRVWARTSSSSTSVQYALFMPTGTLALTHRNGGMPSSRWAIRALTLARLPASGSGAGSKTTRPPMTADAVSDSSMLRNMPSMPATCCMSRSSVSTVSECGVTRVTGMLLAVLPAPQSLLDNATVLTRQSPRTIRSRAAAGQQPGCVHSSQTKSHRASWRTRPAVEGLLVGSVLTTA